MIRRNPLSAGTNHSEPLYQASFTAMKGIDATKAITVPNVVQNMENLDVNTDGSVSVRKPLILKKSYTTYIDGRLYSASQIIKLYDSYFSLVVYTDGTDQYVSIVDSDGLTWKVRLCVESYSTGYPIPMGGAVHYLRTTDAFRILPNSAVNTASSTVLSAKVNLQSLNNAPVPELDPVYVTQAPRYLQITKTNDSEPIFTITVKHPEVNTLTSGAEFVQNPNLTLDNMYATRDVYKSNYIAIEGIVPYLYCESEGVPAEFDINDLDNAAALSEITVEAVTEGVKYPRFVQVAAMRNRTADTELYVLKAFSNFMQPDALDTFYVWEYTYDGVTWNPWYEDMALGGNRQLIRFKKFLTTKDSNGDYEVEWYTVVGIRSVAEKSFDYVFFGNSNLETRRGDLIVLPQDADSASRLGINVDVSGDNADAVVERLRSAQFRCTVCTVTVDDEAQVIVDTILAQQVYTPTLSSTLELATYDLPNAVYGEKLYYNKRIYSYGYDGFKNNILRSDVNSLITPLFNVIDVNAVSDTTVTALVPWRDYLIAGTPDSVHLITFSDGGAFTRTVSTATGIPAQDHRTCKAILNGIVFKSGSKIYTLYPNTSSGDETILNLSEISHPISHILESLESSNTIYDNFAIGTDRSYLVFIPFATHTYCLKYTYDLRTWSVFKYAGVRFVDYHLKSVDDITIYGVRDDGSLCEFYFDKELKEAYPDFIDNWEVESFDDVPYGDFLTDESLNPPAEGGFPNPNPIHFILDSGQRTDNISLTRKFVESKFLLATLNSKSAANLTVDVYVDGNPYKTRLKGDGIVFKTMPNDIITLGDDNPSDGSDVYNSISQAFLRYSGKGKTIRHVIEGDSLYNFKLYEVFYRYRPMPNKQ